MGEIYRASIKRLMAANNKSLKSARTSLNALENADSWYAREHIGMIEVYEKIAKVLDEAPDDV